MSGPRRLEITVETFERTVLLCRGSAAVAFCPACAASARHYTVAESRVILSLNEMDVYHLAASGKLHSRETPDGRLGICGPSLAAFYQDEKE